MGQKIERTTIIFTPVRKCALFHMTIGLYFLRWKSMLATAQEMPLILQERLIDEESKHAEEEEDSNRQTESL